MDGGMIGDPTVANNANDRLEAFIHGTDNRLWHGYQEGGPTGVWRRWFTLGNVIAGNPAATRGPQGRLHVFARGTDNALWQLYQDPPGTGWGRWRSLGGQFAGDPQVVTDGFGLLYVVATAADGQLLTTRQNSAEPEDFSPFTSLGRAVPPAPVPTAPATPASPAATPTPTPAPRLRTINVTIAFTHYLSAPQHPLHPPDGQERPARLDGPRDLRQGLLAQVLRQAQRARDGLDPRDGAQGAAGRDEAPRRGHRPEHDRRRQDADRPVAARAVDHDPLPVSGRDPRIQPADRS